MTEFRQEYELSIWEDVSIESTGNIGHFEEHKIAVIGAHDLHTPTKAYNVTLKENVNGEKTLTFSIPRMYRDKNGELIDNPFLSLLTAERKLKFRDGEAYVCEETEDINKIVNFQNEEDKQEKWYDFVIKSIDEDRDKYVNNYTCKELFVNELGKNGWSIVLDEELMNNYGALEELGERVLEGSGWSIGTGSFLPNERVAEPLFIGAVNELEAKDKDGNGITITGNIYPFFSQLTYTLKDAETEEGAWKANPELSTIQFLYKPNGFSETDLDDNRAVIDDNATYNYFADAADLSDVDFKVTGGTGNAQDTTIQGKKLVSSIRSQYEPVSKKYVNLYTANDNIEVDGKVAVKVEDTVYHYKESVYIAPEMVTNLIANATAFVTTTGWQRYTGLKDDISPVSFPVYEGKLEDASYETFNPINYLEFSGQVFNIGPEANHIDCKQGDRFVVMTKASQWNEDKSNVIPCDTLNGILTADLVSYKNNVYTSISTDESLQWRDHEDWQYYIITIQTSISRLGDDVYLELNTGDSTILLENIQLFPYIQIGESEEDFLTPESIPNAQLIYEDHYFCIDKDNNEVIALPSDASLYTPVSNGYTAVRSLSVKESNYFNNVNSLAELFECWVAFKVKHCKNGKLWLQDNKPVKTVVFSQYSPTGKENSAGFRYGKNIKSIKRTVKSDTVASKLIVKNNNNEFAVDGMASITRAVDNPIADNIVYNFDYYIAHGLLDATTLYRDLYGMSSNDFGYYRELKRINDELLPINEQIVAVQHNLYSAQEWLNTYEMALQSAIEKEEEEKSDYEHTWNLWYGSNAPDGTVNNKITEAAHALSTATARRIEYEKEVTHYTALVEQYKEVLADNSDDGLLNRAKELKDEKIALNGQFYVKYARFIQEATWTDEKYVDDNLYYYDAKKVSAQNAWPKTSYTIGAIETGIIPKYAAYAFTIGDRSYIEDTEFFGYTYIPNPMDSGNSLIKTPVRKEVVVSERSRNFDDPSKSTLSIKTYKNQFEDLFSKLTATTQSLQYSSGEYQRAANTVNADGSLSVESLESTFANNAFILANAANQSVLWDSGSGIEVKNLANSAELVRVVSNGIMLSDNGGKTWTTGISARGINTRLLTAGTINASNINIYSGASDSIFAFRWSDTGINAIVPGTGGGKYVRFNELGLYGTDKGLDLEEELNKVTTFDERLALVTDRQYTNFALTWEGLNLAYQDGALSLQPKSGMEIFSSAKFSDDYLNKLNVEKYNAIGEKYRANDYIPLISLGRYKDVNNKDSYGLRMRNNLGEVTLDTNGNDGNLWLKNSLTLGAKQVTVEVESTDGVKTQEFVYRGTAGISGKISEGDSVNYAFWAGDEGDPNFFVTHTGILKAKEAEIGGQITGEGLEIVDSTSKQAVAGINKPGLAFWSGPFTNGDEDTSYNFSVTTGGILNATGANITGIINATSGSFTGKIEAESGSIKKILFGKQLQSYIGGDDNNVLNINNKFKVEQNGDFYGEKLSLISYLGIDGNTQYRVRIGASEEEFVNINNNFIVDANGKVTLAGELDTVNGLKLIKGKFNIGDNIIIDKNSIRHANDSWQINADGDARFNNATINGILQSTVFEHSTSSAIAGDMWIAPAFFAKLNPEKTPTIDNGKKTIYIPVPTGNESVWEAVDLILIDNGSTAYPCSYNDGYLMLTVDVENNIEVDGKQIISQSSKVNNIKISANDEKGPYISMTYSQNDNSSKVVLGNLEKVSNGYFGDLEGHGLYADNAYLTGKLYLPNAGITNEGGDSTSVRIWAGSDSTIKDEAPFRVLQDGSLYASKGIFSGQVNAVDSYFSGVLSAAGVVLQNDDGDNTTTEHQRFFFHYLMGSATKHIGAIESDGVKMWEGSLAAYQVPKSFNGDAELQTLAKTATPVFETLNNDKTPRTYVDKLQMGGNQKWTSALDGTGLIFKRLKGIDYASIKESYNEDTEAAILKTDESLDIKASIINLMGVSTSEDDIANSIVKLTGTMEFNSTFEIETVEDGIVFNYIGD